MYGRRSIEPVNLCPGKYSQFDTSVATLLIGLGGEKYVDIFKSRNISQETLMELTDDDLEKLGVDDPVIRSKITSQVKDFPIYEQVTSRQKLVADLDIAEVSYILRDSNQHLHRIYLSMLSIGLSLNRPSMSDLTISDKPVTKVIDTTLDEITVSLQKLENILQTNFKCLIPDKKSNKKKIIVGTIGGATIVALAAAFVYSLKHAR